MSFVSCALITLVCFLKDANIGICFAICSYQRLSRLSHQSQISLPAHLLNIVLNQLIVDGSGVGVQEWVCNACLSH